MKFAVWVRSSWINGPAQREVWVDSGTRGTTQEEAVAALKKDQPLVYECSEIEVRPVAEPEVASVELLEVSARRALLGGFDIYREGAAIAYDVPVGQVTREQRQVFKERFFLFTYRWGTTRDNVRALVKAVAGLLREELALDSKTRRIPDGTGNDHA